MKDSAKTPRKEKETELGFMKEDKLEYTEVYVGLFQESHVSDKCCVYDFVNYKIKAMKWYNF